MNPKIGHESKIRKLEKEKRNLEKKLSCSQKRWREKGKALSYVKDQLKCVKSGRSKAKEKLRQKQK